MRITRQNETLSLAFNFLESRLLHRILKAILRHYRLKPGELQPGVAAVWYSTRGCRTARMSAEETSQWIENLHRDKNARAPLLEQWAQQLTLAKTGQSRFQVSVDQASELMAALNDHRLWMAARHDIGQAEMDAHSISAMARLQPTQQSALIEIHFLACIIEEILRALSSAGPDSPRNPGEK